VDACSGDRRRAGGNYGPADEIKRARAPEAILGATACRPVVTGNFAITTQEPVPGSAPTGACLDSDV
jgi:hypothetical protein